MDDILRKDVVDGLLHRLNTTIGFTMEVEDSRDRT